MDYYSFVQSSYDLSCHQIMHDKLLNKLFPPHPPLVLHLRLRFSKLVGSTGGDVFSKMESISTILEFPYLCGILE